MSQGSSFTDLAKKTQRGSALEHLPPAIPADKTTDGSTSALDEESARIKPQKAIFERYDTYIVCPGCGSLLPKGTKLCDCGYDLINPATKATKRILRYTIPVILCLCCIVGGYFSGRASMKTELDAQYKAGYDAGIAIGYEDGTEDMDFNMSSAYEDGYRSAMEDCNISCLEGIAPPLLYEGFSEESNLRASLASEYGLSATPFQK